MDDSAQKPRLREQLGRAFDLAATACARAQGWYLGNIRDVARAERCRLAKTSCTGVKSLILKFLTAVIYLRYARVPCRYQVAAIAGP